MLAPLLLEKYRYENCAVLALNDGGVVVGAQIAAQLHCVLGLLVVEEVKLPQETESIGAIAMDGTFSYNSDLSSGEVEEFQSEYRGFLEEQKLDKLHAMNRLLIGGGTMSPELLQGRHIILVADGIRGQGLLTAAGSYLKPVKHEKIIVVTPMADVPALDKIHVMADEIHCLNVVDDTFAIDHYFEKNDIPDHETIVKIIENIILHWR